MIELPSASVIIITRNKAPYLHFTFVSFANQTHAKFEIIIIDDGSDDSTAVLNVIKQHETSLSITFVRNEFSKGYAAARNQAILMSGSDVIIVTDDDRIAEPDFVMKHIHHYVSGENKVVIGLKYQILTYWRKNKTVWPLFDEAIQSFIANNGIIKSLGDYEDWHCFTNEHEIKTNFHATMKRIGMGLAMENGNEILSDLPSIEHSRYIWSLATTANVSFMRRYAVEAGLLDENFTGWGVEDTEFFYRMYENRSRFIFDTEIRNYHQLHPRGISGQLNDVFDEMDNRIKNERYFLQKHPNIIVFLYVHQHGRGIVFAERILDHIQSIEDTNLRTQFIEMLFGIIDGTASITIRELESSNSFKSSTLSSSN